MSWSLLVKRFRLALGAVAGHLVGWLLAIYWLMVTGNLVMPEPEYVKRRVFILVAIWSIVGFCTVAGGLLGGIGLLKEDEPPDSGKAT
jgi:hypothetical protein